MVGALNATDVRKNWGGFIDDTIRVKPQFITRSRDSIIALSVDTFKDILSTYTFTATLYKEEDGSVTASLDQIDIVVNGQNEGDALNNLAKDLHEYAVEYYQDFSLWATAKNRKNHLPYILNVIAQKNLDDVRRLITWQDGLN